MEKHIEELFNLKKKSIDFLLNEAKICSRDIELDL